MHGRKVYICDPDKNTECAKTSCHINGGDCRLTFNEDFAVEEDNQHED